MARLGRALGLAGTVRFWKGEVAAATEDLERPARYAREAGDRAQEVESIQYILLSLQSGPTPVPRALEGVDQILRRAEGNRRLEMMTLRTRAHLEGMRGRFDFARELIARAKTLAEELGLELYLAAGVLWTATLSSLRAGIRKSRL